MNTRLIPVISLISLFLTACRPVTAPAPAPIATAAPSPVAAPITNPVELAPQQLVAKIPVGSSPHRLAIGEGGVWVTNEDGDTVSRIDPQTNQVVATIPVGDYPRSLAIGFGSVWIANIAVYIAIRLPCNRENSL